MKYYTPSTGQVSEKPPTVGGNTSGIGNNGGMDLQTLLGYYEIAKGNPTGAWNILKPQAETAESRNRKSSLKPAKIAIQNAMKEKYSNTGIVSLPEQLSIKYLGGIGARQQLVKQNQNFQLLRQNVVRALQGARMSDADIKLAGEYIPQISDTPETIQTKLLGLNEFIDNLTGDSKPPLSTFDQ